jgi:CRP/FNR family transcriptional regulator
MLQAMDDTVNILGRTELFKGLSEAGRKRVASICRQESFGKREYLFHEGEKAHAVFFLTSGSVQLLKTTLDGKEMVIRTIKPGEMFAEVVLFERNTYPVTAMALARSALYKIPALDFNHLLEDRSFRNEFIMSIMRRQRYLADRILYLTTSDAEERFFRFLIEHHGRGGTYQMTLSKKNIAAEMGATPETFSRLILKLSKEKKIQWQGKMIRVRPDVLESVEVRP